MATKKISFYFLLLFFSVSNEAPLNLNLNLNSEDWATVWGPEKSFFQLEWEDYFNSKNGIYHFAFDTGEKQDQIFRSEKRLLDGTVVGFYGFIDPEGVLRITEYIAGLKGYRQRTIIRKQIFLN